MSDFQSRKWTFSKIFGVIFLALTFLLVLFLASLPTLISSQRGKAKVLAVVNRDLNGKVEISQLSLNWFGPQTLGGIVIKDSENKEILSIDKVVAHSSLISLLWKKWASGHFEVQNLSGLIETDRQGITNFQRIWSHKCCSDKQNNQIPISVLLKSVQAK